MELEDVKNSEEFSIPFQSFPPYLGGERISPFITNCTRFDFLSGDDCRHIPIESDVWKQNQRTIMKQKINKLINESIF